jgi:hypothetical protein
MKHRIESLGRQDSRKPFLILDAYLMKDCTLWNSVGEAGGKVIHNLNRMLPRQKLPAANRPNISSSPSDQNPCH